MISLIADTHFRDDRPINRKDDYYQAQLQKFDWCLKQAPTMLHAGDFFHRPRCSHKLLCDLIYLIKEAGTDIIVIPGQHDLIGQNIDSIWRTPLGVLAEAGIVRLLLDTPAFVRNPVSSGKSFGFRVFPAPFDCEPPEPGDADEFKVLLIHKLILGPNNQGSFPGVDAPNCKKMLKTHPKFDLIVSGDNHVSFAYTGAKRNRICNPGSMMRATKDQVTHKPSIGLIDPTKVGLGFHVVNIPVEEDVFYDAVPAMAVNPMVERLINELRTAAQGHSIDSFNELLRRSVNENSHIISPDVRDIIFSSLEVI